MTCEKLDKAIAQVDEAARAGQTIPEQDGLREHRRQLVDKE